MQCGLPCRVIFSLFYLYLHISSAFLLSIYFDSYFRLKALEASCAEKDAVVRVLQRRQRSNLSGRALQPPEQTTSESGSRLHFFSRYLLDFFSLYSRRRFRQLFYICCFYQATLIFHVMRGLPFVYAGVVHTRRTSEPTKQVGPTHLSVEDLVNSQQIESPIDSLQTQTWQV